VLDQIFGCCLLFGDQRDDSLAERDVLVDGRARVRDRQTVDHPRQSLGHIDCTLQDGSRQDHRELLAAVAGGQVGRRRPAELSAAATRRRQSSPA